jgi:hypothetical protein
MELARHNVIRCLKSPGSKKLTKRSIRFKSEDVEEYKNSPLSSKEFPPKSYIYFIGDMEKQVVKIGMSQNVERRKRAIQTYYPWELKVFHIVEGDEKKEKWFHKWFKRYRIKNEWFEIKGKVNQYCEFGNQMEVNY